MQLVDILANERIALDISVSSKKSLLEKAAELLALSPDATSSRAIFNGLCQRERLGSTGLGHGVAIPHCRVEQIGVSGAFIRLRRPIDFDSPDSEKVDLFFALSVPAECSETHLRLLASIAGIFSDASRREAFRTVALETDLIGLLNEESADPGK
ncbi:MAG: PTS sugar transporter subunit IIA [Pseudomonadota bacterium]